MPISKLNIDALIQNVKQGRQVLRPRAPLARVTGRNSGSTEFYGPGDVYFCIEKAARQKTLLQISYTDAEGNSTIRIVEPYEIRGDSLFAFCHARNEIRRFKMYNISGAVVLRQKFNPQWEILI